MNATSSSPGVGSDALKRAAAEAAAQLVENDMVVGLGSGTTAAFAIEALARRHRQGLRFVGIPTSELTAARAKAGGLRLTSFSEHRQIDLTIDGADEVERGTLNLIKGLGGALLREKIVAAASHRLAIVIDGSKMVDRLGTQSFLPVEVVAFGLEATRESLEVLGASARARMLSPIMATAFLIAISARSPIRRGWRSASDVSSVWWEAGFLSAAPIRFSWPMQPASTASTVHAPIGGVRPSW
jgi:ribose 5-phosphate isomerase A